MAGGVLAAGAGAFLLATDNAPPPMSCGTGSACPFQTSDKPLALTLVAVGAPVALTGLVWWLLEPPARDSRLSLTVGPQSVGVGGHF
jgi:hypothetical protein